MEAVEAVEGEVAEVEEANQAPRMEGGSWERLMMYEVLNAVVVVDSPV